MVTPFGSLVSMNAMGLNAQNDFVLALLPALAVVLGSICVTSYIVTRVVKKLI